MKFGMPTVSTMIDGHHSGTRLCLVCVRVRRALHSESVHVLIAAELLQSKSRLSLTHLLHPEHRCKAKPRGLVDVCEVRASAMLEVVLTDAPDSIKISIFICF